MQAVSERTQAINLLLAQNEGMTEKLKPRIKWSGAEIFVTDSYCKAEQMHHDIKIAVPSIEGTAIAVIRCKLLCAVLYPLFDIADSIACRNLG